MNSTLGLLFGLTGIAAWIWLVASSMALRRYAVTRGLLPAHAWKLYGEIWRDKEHRMRPSLDGLIAGLVLFLLCVAAIMYIASPKGTGNQPPDGQPPHTALRSAQPRSG